HLASGDTAAAEPLLWGALRLRDLLADKHRLAPNYRDELATSHDAIGQLYQQQNEFEEAASAFRDGLLIREELRNQFPDVPQYEVNFAASQINLGYLYKDFARYEEAADYFRTALEILSRVVQAQPDHVPYREHLAGVHHNLAVVLHLAKKYDEARAHCQQCIAQRQAMLQQAPESDAQRDALAGSFALLAEIEQDDGRLTEALDAYREVVALRKPLAVAGGPRRFALSLGESYGRVGTLEATLGDFAAARKSLEGAIDALAPLVTADSAEGPALQLLQMAHVAHSQMCDELHDPDAAVADWDAMLQLASQDETPLLRLRRAASLARGGRHPAAASAAQEIAGRDVANAQPRWRFEAACVLSLSAAAAEQDDALAPHEQKQIAQGYLDDAVALIKLLHAAGQFDDAIPLEQLRSHPDLVRLLAYPPMQTLLADLESVST
ncbi:MAG: tetratricopeptide repeat protein, partial [Planctomycetales bacterium]|nr:tetratricopeptide repeat protein [Planctomycetales bacterium]